MTARAIQGERGAALLAVLTATALLVTLAVSLALTTSVEVQIAANQRDGLQTLHAADAALAFAVRELGAAGDWDGVLAGAVTSWFHHGAAVAPLPDGGRLDLPAATGLLRCGRVACSEPDMDALSAERPWGRNNPRWTIYAAGPMARLLGDVGPAGRVFVVVWVADDPAENDGLPFRDGGPPARVDAANQMNPGQGALWLHVEAFGPSGARRAIESVIERDPRLPPSQVRMRTWREIT